MIKALIPVMVSLLGLFDMAATHAFRTKPQENKTIVFTTSAKPVAAKMIYNGVAKSEIEIRAAFTVTGADDDDDTVKGTAVYTIPDGPRHRIVEATGADPATIPATFVKKEVTIKFQKGTACPLIHLMVPSAEIEIAGMKLTVDRFSAEIRESSQQINQLFCSWTRQINAGKPHRGIIAAINRLINGEP